MNAFSDLIPSATPPDNASTPDQSAPASGLPQATVDRAMAIYQGRRDRGDDSATALGWAANGVLESKGTPYTPRSSTGAAGTFQWLGDRLKKIKPAQLPEIDAIWQAHKLRNQIAHEQDFKLKRDLAERTLGIYEKALRELKVLD